MNADLIWTFVAFFFTLMILSYILGDNPLFRVGTYIFVGVSAGYIATLLIYQVLFPRLIVPLFTLQLGGKLLLIIPIILSILLIFKLFPRFSAAGNISMAFLVGAGAAIAISGALMGTLKGQINGAIQPFDLSQNTGMNDPVTQLISGLVLLIGTIGTLAYFHFGSRRKSAQESTRSLPLEILAKIGQIFIGVTLGSLFAGVVAAALTALIERLNFIWTFIQTILS